MEEELVSKSERKRQAHRLQALGRELAELKAAHRAALPLPEKLAQALADYQRFPSHGARRRQLQFIGRLMRDIDIEPVEAALQTLQGQSVAANYHFQQLEQWRERLLAEPDAVTVLLDEHPEIDHQQLRHQVQRVLKAKSEAQQRGASRELFRFLRESIHPV